MTEEQIRVIGVDLSGRVVANLDQTGMGITEGDSPSIRPPMGEQLKALDCPQGIDRAMELELTVDAAHFASSETAEHPYERRRVAE
jgi:hypothetical protein